MDLGLAGKGALVVGAGDDVGRATAVLLGQEGARLFLAGRTLSRLEETAAEIVAAGGEVHILASDLNDTEGAQRIARQALDCLGGLDILVNTVGPFPRDSSVTEPMYGHDESWRSAFEGIFMTAVRICREVVPEMKARGRGAVVNLAANSARYYHPRTAQYAAMKAALTHITKNWARDGARQGVRVNAVLPGWIKGRAIRAVLAREAEAQGKPLADIERAMIDAHDALFWSDRMGDVDDYASVIAFLVSDRASYVNGALVPVDGGSPVW